MVLRMNMLKYLFVDIDIDIDIDIFIDQIKGQNNLTNDNRA